MKTVQVNLIIWTTLVEFSGEARFQIFAQKWLLGNIKYFVSFKLKSLKSNGFKAGSHDPSFSQALFQLIEMSIRVSNFFEFE